MNEHSAQKPEGERLEAIERLPLEDRSEAYAELLDSLRTELEADGRE